MLNRTRRDLGIDEVISKIKAECLSPLGAQRISNDTLIRDEQVYLEKQNRISLIMRLFSQVQDSGLSSFPDISPYLCDIQDKPYMNLDGPAIYLVGLFLKSAFSMAQFLDGEVDGEHPLSGLIGEIPFELHVLSDEIFNILEDPGEVKKTHPAIAKAIAEIERLRRDRADYSNALLARYRDIMQSDRPSYKDSRVLIPLRSDQKSKMPGLVHSISASSQTLYMEPLELVQYNNNVVLAEQNLVAEIQRLIGKLSAMVRKNEIALRELSSKIAEADSLIGYAKWAAANRCTKVSIPQSSSIKLLNCRHPLLKNKAVPITVVLEPSVRTMVISGPNAGGKTVTIKTVGLMAVLNQLCGYIPASDGAELSLFDNIFTDIGDDQSIENELSTFSAHMRQVSYILRTMTNRSLVILDELGSGTDEAEGSCIAKAVCEYCLKKDALTLISSHHNALKQFAYATDKVINASMEFDEQTHKPTFRVIGGLPGESHAIDTAKRMHMPKEVISNALSYMGKTEMNISSMIKALEQKRLQAEKRIEAVELKEKALAEKIRENDLRALKVDQQEYLMKQGKLREMDRFVEDTRKDLEALVRELREGEITREKTLKVKNFISEMERKAGVLEEKVEEKGQKIEERISKNRNIVFREGDSVLCGTFKREGTVTQVLKNGSYKVNIGTMGFTFKGSELEPAPKVENRKVHIEYEVTTLKPKMQIDVRGMYLAQALEAVNNQIESCLVHGLSAFTIIHGYGDGILSTGIHRELKKNRNVTSCRFADPDDGGQGKTYVTL